jgi:hypothetical protein
MDDPVADMWIAWLRWMDDNGSHELEFLAAGDLTIYSEGDPGTK